MNRDVPGMYESRYILFVAKIVSASGLPFSDGDFLDWLSFARKNACDDDGDKLGMFTLWQSFLVSRGQDLCQDCWNGNCVEEECSSK